MTINEKTKENVIFDGFGLYRQRFFIADYR